ncbi:MAG: 3-phosphoshikimate 1-carboxyvinyltransferase [Victivallaceae bacterium]
MKLIVKPSRLRGSIAVPGSKSHTIRGVVAALAASGVSRLIAPLESADTRSTLAAAVKLGASCRVENGLWEITGCGGKFTAPEQLLDLGNSGTGLRLLSAMAANGANKISFDGDDSLRTRLMKGLLDALTLLGVETSSTAGKCPLTVKGPIRGGKAKVDGTTSQFLSALLFAAPLAPGNTELELDFLNEKPYVDITLGWLDRLGIVYEKSADMLRFGIPGGQVYRGFDYTIPADFSTAAFPLAAAALVGDGVTICNLDFNDLQGDKKVFDFFSEMGATYEQRCELLVKPAPAHLSGGVFDLNATPDALPVMAAAAACAHGVTKLVNVPQARVKETDRIACMTRELGKMGAEIEELPDGMVIGGGRLHGAELDGCGDHRIVMALAVAALAADGESVIGGAEAAAVTYPDFVTDFKALGADFTLES